MKLDTKNNRQHRRLSKEVRKRVPSNRSKHPIMDCDGFESPNIVRNPNPANWNDFYFIQVGRGWLIQEGLA